MKSGPRAYLDLMLFALSLACGCAISNVAEHAKTFRLPPPKLSPESVVLEVAQLKTPTGDDRWEKAVWESLDEQGISAELRRALLKNGIRAGISGTKLPEPVYEQLSDSPGEAAPNRDLVGELENQYRRVQLRPETRSDIVMSDPIDTMVLFTDGEDSLSGRSLTSAQPQFALFATPRGDGGANVRLVPEVHYGGAKQKFVGENGVFRIEPGRDKIAYEDLTIAAELAAGETLVVTATGPRHSIGGNLFQGDGADPKKILLIRLAQSQYDELFDADER